MNNTATTTVTCPRCHGFDNAYTRFGHIANGKCLRCLGAKTVEVDTAKLNSARGSNATAIAKAKAECDAKPYIVFCDGGTVGKQYATWQEARAKLDRLAGNGYENRIAKWDGECFRYRDGTQVKFSN